MVLVCAEDDGGQKDGVEHGVGPVYAHFAFKAAQKADVEGGVVGDKDGVARKVVERATAGGDVGGVFDVVVGDFVDFG